MTFMERDGEVTKGWMIEVGVKETWLCKSMSDVSGARERNPSSMKICFSIDWWVPLRIGFLFFQSPIPDLGVEDRGWVCL